MFIIDAFNKVKLPRGNKIDEINDVLSRLTMFCQVHNVTCVLVAHPTKMKKNEQGTYEIPTLYDVAGSADFRNQTHNGFAIHRYFETENEQGHTKFVNLKTKFSFQGDIGASTEFLYHEPTGRMYAKGQPVPLFDLTQSEEEEQQEEIFNALKPNKQFEWLDNPSGDLEF